MRMGQAIYEREQAGAAGAAGPAGGSTAGGKDGGADDVVDAEFSEVDDNK